MNLLGLRVADLDVEAFLGAARMAFVVAAIGFLALARARGPRFLLGGVVLANAYLWLVTNYPLQRLYALGPSQDRIGNLGLCQVVAAGNSPLRTFQVGQLHFEPLWGLLVAVVSGFDPERVLRIYPFLSLVVVMLFTVTLSLGMTGWRRAGGESEEAKPSAWEAVLAAGAATLLSSVPFDFIGTYRVPWAMTFLLKPNHALGLVLFPVFLRTLADARGWRGRLAAGLLLHLVGWAFVLHMAYVCVGLLVFAALAVATGREHARRDVLDVSVAIGVNLAVVSPYLVMLLVGYPFLEPHPRATIFAASPHLLETTARHGPIVLLGAWGALVAYRARGRFGRLWAAQVIGAHLIWASYLLLDRLQMARERDEIFYWVRFLTAASAGIGAWDVASRIESELGRRLAPALRAAVLAAVALPWLLPAWWNPARMDLYFQGSLSPVPAALEQATTFLRGQTDPRAVVAGDRELAKWVAALGARRVLFSPVFHKTADYKDREALEAAMMRESDSERVRSLAAPFGVRYLTVTPALLDQFEGVTLEDLDRRPHLRRRGLWGTPGEFIAVFELGAPASRAPGPNADFGR